ncbi:MAG TPA: response regulator [Clostridiaceae bacterium]|nr:response regulator [Clostridiaceae bacterium]
MLKVMIVDDEFYFREALKISIPWNEIGLEVCGEAKNGKDALEKVETLNPDIILADINMSIMDGLEFIKRTREKDISSKIVIITGYSEFDYARQAVQLGVYNYLLKPVNEEELVNTLLDIKKVIEKESNIKVEIDKLKRQVKDSLPMLKDKFLNELLQGSLIRKDSETLKKMEYLNINTGSEYYLAVTIEMDYEESYNWNDEDKQLWKFAVSNITNEILREQFAFDLCYDNDDRICIIIGVNEEENKNDFNQLLENKLEYLKAAVYKYLNFTVTIGVGCIKNTLFDIAASYKESIVALKNKITLGRNRIITYESVADSEIKIGLFTVEHRSQLLMNMRIGDEEEALNLINQIFNEIREKNIHHEIVFVVCVEMVSLCMEFIVEIGLSFKDIIPNNQLNIIEEFQSKRSIEEIEGWIKGIFRDTFETAKRSRSSKASKLVEEVKQYISEHYYKEELTVDEIAKHLFVNYAHLCFVFKRDTGITINEYLTKFRINKAKELMDSGNTLILDVANRVGYADANYFGKCFKKYFGIAPSKYIKNIGNR